MNYLLLGGTGFLGSNLAIALARGEDHTVTVTGRSAASFAPLQALGLEALRFRAGEMTPEAEYESLVAEQDVVFHLVSTTVPATANQHIAQELTANVVSTARLLDACVAEGVKRVVFLSSGGTVYGRCAAGPIPETAPTDPISSYGVQKLTIEKLLQLFHHMYALDYRIVRLANPYGPYQRPNGIQGLVTNLTYRALRGETVQVYGDGSVVRDYLYVDDAVRGILNIAGDEPGERLYNLGSGTGTSILGVIAAIEHVLGIRLPIEYRPARSVDVPVNVLDISRYERRFGPLQPLGLEEGIARTADFLRRSCG